MPATRTGKRVHSPPTDSMLSGRYPLSSDYSSLPSATSSAPSLASSSTSPLPQQPLFPCSSSPAPRRPSHHKKRPPSHIPRPPNAFILFRANFIRDRHLQSTTSGPLSNVSPTALSTIIGITWRNLPEEERQIWVEKARVAREQHKLQHPSYRYQPLPTAEERAVTRETKRKVKEENIPKPDIQRCQEISRLLVEGHRGVELEEKLAEFDRNRPTQSAGDDSGIRGASQLVRSASLPTPRHRRLARRSRAYSASDSPELEGTPDIEEAEHKVFDAPLLSSPDVLAECIPLSATPYLAEPPLPELSYDVPSPQSINLPEPLDRGYAQASHSASASMYHPHDSRSFPAQPLLSGPASDTYPPSFASLSTWDHGHPITEPYYHFPYFSQQMNDNIMIPDTHITQDHIHPATNADPYASPIPPFQLYHTLKPFEQSCEELSAPQLHAFHDEYAYEYA